MIRIRKADELSIDEILRRGSDPGQALEAAAAIVKEVREGGDEALLRLTERFDHAALSSTEVPREEIEAALQGADPEWVRVLTRAAEQIRDFHRRQVRQSFLSAEREGIVIGQRVLPLERVGLYVPGGTASYPSSVLMNAIPAKIAGVRELVMVTPPAPDGSVNPVILTAAALAGVDRVFRIGGAQAVAALAYGTQSVPRVDKIVGPGNAFVAAAKQLVYGQVDIDMIAGPSEILVIADGESNPRFVAADLLSQAEHDRMASAVLITTSETLAAAVAEELETQLARLPRREIARASLEANGKILLVPTLEAAVDLSNAIAPEHLELCVAQPFDLLGKVRSAGSVFLGRYCPESLGDYLAGPNHTLPTGGRARFSSPLSVDDFVKKMQYTYYTEAALREAEADVAYFAMREGLQAHARAARIRFGKEEELPCGGEAGQ